MKSKLSSYHNRPFSLFLNIITRIAMYLTLASLIFVFGYILINGIPHLSWNLVFGEYSSRNPSMLFSIVTTLILVVFSLAIAVPIGVCSAIYLVEYAPQSSRLVRVIRLCTETLAGIPSIVYGLFGALFFGTTLQMGYSILTGGLTVSIMILPVIIRSTEEAIKAVPDIYREGSYGLGATKLRTVMRIVLPSAAPGIFSAVMLSVGRIIGETAALIFTLGSVAKMPGSMLDSSRTLAVHMYISTRDGGMAGRNTAFATACVL
ncbi:MAG: phosphate ABC transporter permease PstA, partial [Clostridia bacterium]